MIHIDTFVVKLVIFTVELIIWSDKRTLVIFDHLSVFVKTFYLYGPRLVVETKVVVEIFELLWATVGLKISKDGEQSIHDVEVFENEWMVVSLTL